MDDNNQDSNNHGIKIDDEGTVYIGGRKFTYGDLGEVDTLDIEDLPRPPVTELTREHYRQAVITVENHFVRPVIDQIADALGVNVIDDEFYRKVVPTTEKSSNLSCILNRQRVYHDTDKGFSEWEGIILLVKNVIVAGAQVRADARTQQGTFRWIRLWNKKIPDYQYLGDPSGERIIRTELIPQIILNYLVQEGITNLAGAQPIVIKVPKGDLNGQL